jgi:hypothetical protein
MFRRSPIIALLLLLTFLLPTAHADAADYWVSLDAARGEIAPGVNGFVVLSHGGAWNSYGNHCQAEAGAYVAGAYCKLRFNVPPGLTAGAVGSGGIARGDYRTANAFAMLRSERPGGNPAGVTDSVGDGAFNHGWQVLGPYVEVGLRFTDATTTTAATNWFHINTFDVLLHDPSAPTIQQVSVGNGGWNGPGCIPHTYAWADSGSQVASMSVTNLTTGAPVDGWAVTTNGPTTGYGVAADTGCTPAPGTGTYTYRTSAVDRAGNGASHDYTLSFDTTAPTIGAPTLDGAPLADGTEVTSAQGYRPAVHWSGVGDAHSGVASVVATLDGSAVAITRTGGDVTLTPGTKLPLGTHELRLTVTDAVGNRTAVARSIVVHDDVAPTLTVASPDASGGSEPVLDVSATDDYSGLATTSWTVKVNGATLVASSSTGRLQANIGYLVDGTHHIVVSVADQAGNVTETTIEYHADSGDGLPDPPSLTGIFVFDSPSEVDEGTTHHVRALVVKDGRPVAGRAELQLGSIPLAGGDIAANGAIDLDVRIDAAGPMRLVAPAASGLAPAEISYVFHPHVDPPACVAPRLLVDGVCSDPAPTPDPPAPQPTNTTTNNTTIINPAPPEPTTGGGAGPTGAAGQPGQAGSPFPRNVVYYVGTVPYWNGLPLAESGAKLDRVAPTWRMRLIQHRAGTVRRARRVAFRLWTSEMSVMSFSPTGSVRRTTVSPRRQQRTVFITFPPRSVLGRRIARARAGSIVRVRVRVVATDKNENRSYPRTLSFRVRV